MTGGSLKNTMDGSVKNTRRGWLKQAAAITAFPAIVPPSVFGQSAPSNRIQVAQIGCGRIARSSEFPGVLAHHALARFVAVTDLDSVRAADAKRTLEEQYAKRLGSNGYGGIRTYTDYREMLEDKTIDAVCISTPDHWHAQPAMEAALAGKDIYLQKPASLTIEEGRHMADVLKKTGRILQLGSQQRSAANWRLACELVRNGRIGKLKEIYVGLPYDPAGGNPNPMPKPATLDYDFWLGSTPAVPYTEDRVHPQTQVLGKRYDRPGWLRCRQFGAGMITGWGAHHLDIAHWAMDVEYGGPLSAVALAEFPPPGSGLWDVHGSYHVRMRYPNNVTVYVGDYYPTGVKFVGEEGWIWVTRGKYKAGDPPAGERIDALDAHDPRILREGTKPSELHLHASPREDHHLDWLESVRTRRPPATNAEIGHRSCSACLVAHIAMQVKGELRWDARSERFTNSDEANGHLGREQRAPYGTKAVIERSGWSARA